MSGSHDIKYDLAVIGTGLAGMSAALFAISRGLSIVQAGSTGEIIFASGLLDLMGVHPLQKKKFWNDPWAAIDALVRDFPNHPYAKLSKEDIRTAFNEVLWFLQEAGLPYNRRKEKNSGVITPMGTIKSTYCVPQTMWNGVQALEKKSPCLLIDIRGLKGFSAHQIASTLRNRWPGLRTARIDFPGTNHSSEIQTEHMASALVLSKNRKKFAQTLRRHIKHDHAVGMPAILGLYRSKEVVAELENQLGVSIFEIPTMPPSVPGLRLKEAFERRLREQGVKLYSKKRVLEVQVSNGCFILSIGTTKTDHTVRASGVILASGRFIGKGLHADRKHIRETIFDLPVYQPADRASWHRDEFLDPRGHPINRAGLEIDNHFRPLDSSGRPAYETLFAAGSILAHQDWMRQKCGAGLAIASAHASVNAYLKLWK